eukprot:3439365-Rhodomonas_salina.3
MESRVSWPGRERACQKRKRRDDKTREEKERRETVPSNAAASTERKTEPELEAETEPDRD